MATLLTHPLIPLVTRAGFGRDVISSKLLIFGVIASIIPDADVISFYFGISYASEWGHRGFTHSFAFAGALGVLAIFWRQYLGATSKGAFWFIFISAASHPLLDGLTDGGLGSAFFWPIDKTRYFLPWQPIEVSPIGLSRFLSPRGISVFISEIYWVWLPLFVLMLGFRLNNRKSRGNE